MKNAILKVKNFIVKTLKYIFYVLFAIVTIYFVADEMFISNSEIDDMVYSQQEFSDGEYLAEVRYNNTCTGFKSFYELYVILEGDSLIRINFENGGYIEKSEFISKKLEPNKYVDILDKNGCTVYSVKITSSN